MNDFSFSSWGHCDIFRFHLIGFRGKFGRGSLDWSDIPHLLAPQALEVEVGGGGGGGGGGTSSSLIRKFDRLDLWISGNGSWPRALAWHRQIFAAPECPTLIWLVRLSATVNVSHIGVAAGGWIRVFRAHVGPTSCSVRLKIWRLEIKNWLMGLTKLVLWQTGVMGVS